MDCSFDGEQDPSITADEWQKLEDLFKHGPAKEIIKALKRTDNSPQEVVSFGTKMRVGSIGGMNSSLLRAGIPFRLELVYTGRLFRENQLYLKRVALPRPKIVETSNENSRRCC